MEIIRLGHNHSVTFMDEIVATIGEFDGIHIAHQMLFQKTLELSSKYNKKSAVITFDPHPDLVLGKNDYLLLSASDKIDIISKYGFDYLFIIEFDDNILSMSHFDFVNKFLLNLNIVHLVVGFDFRYGYKGLGNCSTLNVDSDGKIDVVVVTAGATIYFKVMFIAAIMFFVQCKDGIAGMIARCSFKVNIAIFTCSNSCSAVRTRFTVQ